VPRRAVTNRTVPRRRGIVSVELALTLPLLLLLLFGIAELSLIFADESALANASRQAARAASLGQAVENVQSVAINSLPHNITLPTGNISLQHRSLVSGSWTAWTALADTNVSGVTTNNAASGDQIQVMLTYAHPLVTSLVLQNARQGTITLHGISVALRF
jgi:Flp pilus assembly protein TadG